MIPLCWIPVAMQEIELFRPLGIYVCVAKHDKSDC